MENSKENYAFARDVLIGLGNNPKRLFAKYIYDEAGSKLFEEIMDLPEYYLTRSEYEILKSHKHAFADVIGSEPFNLVELGAGNGEKTMILLEHFLDRKLDFEYVPIDISSAAVEELTEKLDHQLPDLKINGLIKDYFDGLRWLKNNSSRRNFILFMGANIGNLQPFELRQFMQSLWLALHPEDLICIGFDLKKDYQKIRKAYDDSKGVTKQFNMNLLKRINAELGGNFDLDKFEFYSSYNPVLGANEAYLVSLADQEVKVTELQKTFSFAQWEPIHTEYSFKFSIPEIEKIARDNGFEVIRHLFDSQYFFTDSIWKTIK